ncbi:MAG: trehalase-like domain-containing protein, partial [Aquihabitans sp.]
MSRPQIHEQPPGQHHDRPIADYGMIGDTRTAALVGSNGAIDWWCIPRFDGEPVFGRLLGRAAAGIYRMGPREDAPVTTRHYRPDTATIETTWATPGGALTLTEG